MTDHRDLPDYGLDAELKNKAKAKLAANAHLEEQAKQWIAAVTGDSFDEDRAAEDEEYDFCEWLKNGVTLCNLVNAIKPGTIKTINQSKMPFKQFENINAYIQASQQLGVPAADSFMTVDLYEKKNPGAVIQSVHSLGRVAQKLGFNGPKLGAKIAEKKTRQFSSRQIREAKNAVPALTEGASKMQDSHKVGHNIDRNANVRSTSKKYK